MDTPDTEGVQRQVAEQIRSAFPGVPVYIREEAPTLEECEQAAEYALEHGTGTTVFGEVDEYRLSTRPRVVSGGQ